MIAEIQSGSLKSGAPLYQLKVILTGAKPAIWRRLQVPGNANLGWVHAVLQVSVGWTNSHLHLFKAGKEIFMATDQWEDDGFGMQPPGNEKKVKLSDLVEVEGDALRYEYDFGDSWSHQITLEKILPTEKGLATVARCVGGARACPPEDCGGIWGYTDLLKVLKNPKHPEHESMRDWLGRPFAADAFNAEDTNRWLGKLKWPHVTQAQLRRILMARDGYKE